MGWDWETRKMEGLHALLYIFFFLKKKVNSLFFQKWEIFFGLKVTKVSSPSTAHCGGFLVSFGKYSSCCNLSQRISAVNQMINMWL